MNAKNPADPDTGSSAAATLAALPRLARLSNAVSRGRVAERAAEEAGLSRDRPAIGVLLALHAADGPLRVGEIADRLQLAGPHITRQVQALERRGLVHRIEDPYDKRARLIEATPKGERPPAATQPP